MYWPETTAYMMQISAPKCPHGCRVERRFQNRSNSPHNSGKPEPATTGFEPFNKCGADFTYATASVNTELAPRSPESLVASATFSSQLPSLAVSLNCGIRSRSLNADVNAFERLQSVLGSNSLCCGLK